MRSMELESNLAKLNGGGNFYKIKACCQQWREQRIQILQEKKLNLLLRPTDDQYDELKNLLNI